MSDGITVLDDVLAFRYILDQDLMSGWCILVDDNLSAVHLDDFPFSFFLQTHDNTVCLINFYISS